MIETHHRLLLDGIFRSILRCSLCWRISRKLSEFALRVLMRISKSLCRITAKYMLRQNMGDEDFIVRCEKVLIKSPPIKKSALGFWKPYKTRL